MGTPEIQPWAVPVVGDVDSPQSDEFFGFDDGGDGDDLDDGKSDDDKDFDPPLLPPAEAEAAPVSIGGNGGNDGLGEAPTTQTASGRVVEPASKSDRNMGMAIATGVGLAAAFVVSMMVGPWLTMLLVAAIIGLAVAEFYNAVRPVGFPARSIAGASRVGEFGARRLLARRVSLAARSIPHRGVLDALVPDRGRHRATGDESRNHIPRSSLDWAPG